MAVAITMSEELKAIKEHFDRRFDAQDARLGRIEKHAEKTNGRVGALELWRARMEGMKAGVGGSWGVLMGVAGLFIGAAGVTVAIVVAAA